jgi:reactive intermediate/imine deaminase
MDFRYGTIDHFHPERAGCDRHLFPGGARGRNAFISPVRSGLDPQTGQLVEGIENQIDRVFRNLAVAESQADRSAMRVKLTVYLTDLAHFARVNEIMARYFEKPYPARAAVGVAALPRGAQVEADAILVFQG